MSFQGMLAHRCKLIDSVETSTDGSSTYAWTYLTEADLTTHKIFRCFLDLNFLRRGKDSMWVEAAGRPQDRTGVVFFPGNTPVKSGMRIEMTKGPSGIFSIGGALDEAWTPHKMHHLEFGVIEVAAVVKRPNRVNNPSTAG
jgi:hypothetical protein